MSHFEREFWQASITLTPAPIPPEEMGRLLGGVGGLLPGTGMTWQMPALTAPPSVEVNVLELGLGLQSFLVGRSPRGSMVQVSPRQLVVRHQQVVEGGRRSVAQEAFPGRQEFSETVRTVLDALPPTLQASGRRLQLTVSYAMFTDDAYPASLLAEFLGRGVATRWPPPDGAPMVHLQQSNEFETIRGRRFVWNETDRVGNWFGHDGRLLQNAAIVRTVDLMTAIPEPAEPQPVAAATLLLTQYDQLPALPIEEVRLFLSEDGPMGISSVIRRFCASLPNRVEFHE